LIMPESWQRELDQEPCGSTEVDRCALMRRSVGSSDLELAGKLVNGEFLSTSSRSTFNGAPERHVDVH